MGICNTYFPSLGDDQKYHLFDIAWLADYPDPDNFLRVGLGYHKSVLFCDGYDNLIEKARLEIDQAERLRLYKHIDKLLVDSAIVIPLVYPDVDLLVKPWLRNIVNPTFGIDWSKMIIDPHE